VFKEKKEGEKKKKEIVGNTTSQIVLILQLQAVSKNSKEDKTWQMKGSLNVCLTTS